MLKRMAVLMAMTAVAGCGARSNGPALRVETDSLMAAGKGVVSLYARSQDGAVTQIADGAPFLEGTATSYAVFRDSAGAVRVLIETPTSDSREWNNEYRHYFDAQGHTVFFRRYSGFFEGCQFGLAKELLERSYSPEFKVARETYKLTNDAGSPQDSTSCEFRYHFPYVVYPTWDAAAKALQLPAS